MSNNGIHPLAHLGHTEPGGGVGWVGGWVVGLGSFSAAVPNIMPTKASAEDIAANAVHSRMATL